MKEKKVASLNEYSELLDISYPLVWNHKDRAGLTAKIAVRDTSARSAAQFRFVSSIDDRFFAPEDETTVGQASIVLYHEWLHLLGGKERGIKGECTLTQSGTISTFALRPTDCKQLSIFSSYNDNEMVEVKSFNFKNSQHRTQCDRSKMKIKDTVWNYLVENYDYERTFWSRLKNYLTDLMSGEDERVKDRTVASDPTEREDRTKEYQRLQEQHGKRWQEFVLK